MSKSKPHCPTSVEQGVGPGRAPSAAQHITRLFQARTDRAIAVLGHGRGAPALARRLEHRCHLHARVAGPAKCSTASRNSSLSINSTHVLVGSSAIGTGTKGLQEATHTLIFNALPWTYSEYEQIVGRVYRQRENKADDRQVDIIIPRVIFDGEKSCAP